MCDEGNQAHDFYGQFSQKFLFDIYSQGKRNLELEYQRRLSDNNSYWIRDEINFLSDPRTGHLNLMLLVRDINSKKRAEEELAQAAAIDEMTTLLNRTATRRQIQEFLEGPGAEGTHGAFMIDIDDFKVVNDTYGHQEGDTLLIRLAHGLKNCFRESDIVGRIGGDEFFVLAKNMPSREAVKTRAEQLLRVVRDIHSTQTTALTSVSAFDQAMAAPRA